MPTGFDDDFPKPPQMNEAEELLYEWARWWWYDDDLPQHLPHQLELRTSSYFTGAAVAGSELQTPGRSRRGTPPG